MKRRWTTVLAMASMGAAAWAQSSSKPQLQGHFAIGVSQVAQVLSGRGVVVAEQQVSLLANVMATVPQPDLDVLSVEEFGDRAQGRTLVKLVCHEARVCLPFYAVVNAGGTGNTPSTLPIATSVPLARKTDADIAIHAGARAMLRMDDDRMHIRMVVVALENGVVGRTIRVSSPDHKQFYDAQVVGANLLRRSL